MTRSHTGGRRRAQRTDPATAPAEEEQAPQTPAHEPSANTSGQGADDPAGTTETAGDEQSAAPTPDPTDDAMAEAIAELADAAGISTEEADNAAASYIAEQHADADPLACVQAMTEAMANDGALRDGAFVTDSPAVEPSEPTREPTREWVRNRRSGIAWIVPIEKATQLVNSGECVPVLEGEAL